MIAYRLTPSVRSEFEDIVTAAEIAVKIARDPLPPYPTKQQLVDDLALRAQEAGVPYTFALNYTSHFDRRYQNILPPLE